MKWIKLLVLISISMLAIGAIATGVDASRPFGENEENRWKERIREEWGDPWDDEAGEVGEKEEMFGRIVYDPTTGYVQGRYISFFLDEENGKIMKFSLNNVTIFDAIVSESVPIWSWVYVKGSKILYLSAGLTEGVPSTGDFPAGGYIRIFIAHDNPNGLIRLMNFGYNFVDRAHYYVSTGMIAEKLNDNLVRIRGNNISAHLILRRASATIVENEIIVNLSRYSHIIFIAKPHQSDVPDIVWEKLFTGIVNGRLAGYVRVCTSNRKYAADSANFTYEVRMRIRNAERNRLEISVSGSAQGGRAIYVETNRESLDGEIKVSVDGKISRRVSVDAALNGGSESCYAVVESSDKVGIIIWIPAFSEHNIEISAEKNPLTQSLLGIPLYGWLIAIVIAMVVVASIIILRKKK